jgi:hypothetical protein
MMSLPTVPGCSSRECDYTIVVVIVTAIGQL